MDPNSQTPQVETTPQTPVTPPVMEVAAPIPESPPQPIPVETTPPTVETPDGKKNSPILIVAVVLAVIAVLAVVAYAVAGKLLNPQPTATVAPVVSTPTPTPDPTANWKIYTNIKYLYSFKYPQGFIVGQNGMNSPTPESVEDIITYEINPGGVASGPALSVSVFPKGQIAVEAKAQAHFNKVSKYVLTPNPTFPLYKSNSIVTPFLKDTFQNKDAFTYTITGSYYDDLAAEAITPPMERKYIWFNNGSNDFLIRVDKGVEIDQILSTFKLTSATPSASPTIIPTASPTSTPSATYQPY